VRRGRILVTGEAIGDLLPRDEEGRHYEAVLGGSGFNAALALARFGAATAYAGTLSTDAIGWRFRRALAEEGIDAGLVRESGLPSPLAVVAPLGRDGVPAFDFYLDGTAQSEAGHAMLACPPGVNHLHAASFGATVGGAGAAALALIESAKAQRASISFDINIRPAALPLREAARALIERRVALADIVKASVDDLAWLYPGWPADTVAAHWRGLGAALVLVTRGGEGAACHGAAGLIEAATPTVAVVDTVGAGDACIAGFLALLATRGRLGAGLGSASEDDLADALAFACTVAAETCTRPGCDPPRRSPPCRRATQS
jgi:fructokinase